MQPAEQKVEQKRVPAEEKQLADKPNAYLLQVEHVLPRLLALFDVDGESATFGLGDRQRWAWRLSDYANATYQGAVNGLARIVSNGLLPQQYNQQRILDRIQSMIRAVPKIQNPNGSVNEAFPYESSFCVTALVAYDVLTCIECLSDHFEESERSEYLDIVSSLIGFLKKSDETHGFISNHLATAAAALYKWNKISGEATDTVGEKFLSRILSEQSAEGWLREYEGADPGYQTLAMYYLADLHRLRPDLGLAEPLQRALEFVSYFAHPDGSFGGYYGSRNTRFFCPAGIEALALDFDHARKLSGFMRASLNSRSTVSLDTIDENNLVPFFNAYCWSAALSQKTVLAGNEEQGLPSHREGEWRRLFPQAGLLVEKGQRSYSIICWKKGGVVYHFADGKPAQIDGGVVVSRQKKEIYSSQTYCDDNECQIEKDTLIIRAPLIRVEKALPSPWQFVILRCLNMTVMRNVMLGNIVKNMLVRLLITRKKSLGIFNVRTIQLRQDVIIRDSVLDDAPQGFRAAKAGRNFSAILMASQGYWQSQDEAR